MGYGNEFFCRCQEAFLCLNYIYCSKKQNELLQKRYQQQSSMTVRSDPTQMTRLRPTLECRTPTM